MAATTYLPPAWLPGAHLQTIIPATLTPTSDPGFRRERWTTPDGDFIDVDFIDALSDQARTVILFHGLEGSSKSHYARAIMKEVACRGWRGAVVHFRGCSGELNQAPRFYHSGDSAELDWVLRKFAGLFPNAARHAIGVSLGGNVLLKWLGEQGGEAARFVDCAVSVSAPVDLTAGGGALSKGFNLLYTRMFLRSLKPKCLEKLRQFPGLFDRQTMLAANNLHEFDDVVTAPVHGFRNATDYWMRSSSKRWLRSITVPTLILNARNDPFLPAAVLPGVGDVGKAVTLQFPEQGGHVGFPASQGPLLGWLPMRSLNYFAQGQ